ncbi:diacylglycerol/lipid kinase family protein [Larkinella soli]|uniref:diacylglycerol/lipid kinase family protein n=1 Tax=Larkinella soli TaxID=1770527 RepID=UPI000FFC899A|nr:diacylglycerol kinase family protein [Larkinella soli]
MAQTSLLAIVNPLSGTASVREKQQWVDFLKKDAEEAGFVPEAVFTESPGHATELAKAAARQGIGRVLAIGGDGTVNETARALLRTQTALGIVPVGSGNGLGRHLGLPLRPKQAIGRALKGRPVVIDSGTINGLPFFCTTGLGFDAYVAHEFARQATRGLPTYIRTSLAAYRRYRPAEYEVEGEKQRLFSLTVANAGQFGNNAWIAPKANVSDGLLDLCCMKPFPMQAVLMLGYQLFNRTLDRSSYLSILPRTRVVVKGQGPLPVHIDGEPVVLESDTARVEVVPSSLLVIL